MTVTLKMEIWGPLKLRLNASQLQCHCTTTSQSRTDKDTDKEIWDSFSPRLLQLWCPPPPPLYKFHLVGSSVQTQLNLVVKHRHQIEIAYQWLSVLCMSVHRIKFCRDKPLIRFLRSTTFRRAINFKWWQFHLNLVWGIILMIKIGQRLNIIIIGL